MTAFGPRPATTATEDTRREQPSASAARKGLKTGRSLGPDERTRIGGHAVKRPTGRVDGREPTRRVGGRGTDGGAGTQTAERVDSAGVGR